MSNNLTPQNTSLNFVCPKCKTKLEVDNNNYFCCLCQRHYNENLGLRDFRLSFKDSENQIELAQEFVASWDKLTYEDMVHMRFSGLRKRALEKGKKPSDFKMWDADEKAHISSYKIRGKRHLNILKNILKKRAQSEHINRLIDVGCGWGRDLLHLSNLATEVIGIDVSAYSLLMTKKLLEEQGVTNVNLVLAEGETLPIQSESIDGINCSATIEHMKSPSDFLCDSSRCLNNKGWLFLYYPNRYSILPETHTGIWGLGYFSASRQRKIVHNKKGGNWDTILFSRSDFKKIIKSNFKYQEFYITGIPPGIEDFLITSKFSKMYPHLMFFAARFLPVLRKFPGMERFARYFLSCSFRYD